MNIDWAQLLEIILRVFREVIVPLAWPAVALLIAWTFRKDVRALLPRLKRGKLLGGELEFEERVVELRTSVEAAGSMPAATPTEAQPPVPGDASDLAEVFLAARGDPRLGLMRLASKIEQELRRIGAAGYSRGRASIPRLVHDLAAAGVVSPGAASSVDMFWDLRNRIVHGTDDVDETQVLQVLDAGIPLYRALAAIPRETAIVLRTDVPLYSEPDCSVPVPDARGVVLQITSPGGLQERQQILPTTAAHKFTPGNRVSWAWGNRVFERAYYRNERGECVVAWSSAAEFAGTDVK